MADEKKEAPPQDPAMLEAAAPDDKKGKGKKEKKAGPKFSVASLAPREKLVLKFTALALTILVLDLVVIRPIGGYLQDLDEKIKNEEEVIPKRLMVLKYRSKIMNEYQSLEPLMTDPALSQEEEIAKFLRDIERVSKEANLFVSNINPVKVNKKSDVVYELTADIEGKGGLKPIRSFMKTLERDNPALKIDGFNLKPQGKDSDDIKFQFSISKIGVKKS